MADDPNIKPPKPEPPATNANQNHQIPAPILRPELHIPQTVIDEYRSRQTKQDRREWWKLRVECLTLATVVSYTIIAGYQGCQMRKATEASKKSADAAKAAADAAVRQNDLLRQQLEGTMSAIVTFQEPRITKDSVTYDELLVILLLNQGHGIAPEVHASFQINTVSFPDLRKVLESKTETVVVSQLDAGKPWSKNYKLSDFTQREQQFATQRKTITVKGTLGFDNGFGNKFEQPICYSYIGSYNVKNEDGGSTSGGGGFLPCDKSKELVSYVSKRQLK